MNTKEEPKLLELIKEYKETLTSVHITERNLDRAKKYEKKIVGPHTTKEELIISFQNLHDNLYNEECIKCHEIYLKDVKTRVENIYAKLKLMCDSDTLNIIHEYTQMEVLDLIKSKF